MDKHIAGMNAPGGSMLFIVLDDFFSGTRAKVVQNPGGKNNIKLCIQAKVKKIGLKKIDLNLLGVC